MSKVDQSTKINERITLKKKLIVVVHVVYIPLKFFDCHYDITNKNIPQF